jgi:hypothetical protein
MARIQQVPHPGKLPAKSPSHHYHDRAVSEFSAVSEESEG